MFLAAFVLAAADAPPPKTVNGQVIGTAQDYTTAGPATVCMNDVMVSVLPSESVTLAYSGIHHGSLRINRGTSWVDVDVGQIFVEPKQRGEIIERRPTFFIADASNETNLRYGLYAHDEFYQRTHLLAWISGPSFTGEESDRSVLRRIELRTEQSTPCDVAYRFGWEVLLGNEPMAVRRKH